MAELTEATIHPLREGVFLPDEALPIYDTELSQLTFEDQQFFKHGVVRREIAHMDDGTLYPVVTGIPKERLSDTAVVFTTAWLTSTRGHNMRTLLRVMKLGYPVMMIGPEGEIANESLSLIQRVGLAAQASLPKTVHDMNQILAHTLPTLDVRHDELIVLGESRGAMTGAGLDNIAYADLTAPCFARRPHLKELPGIAWQLVPEAATLGKLALKLLQPHMRHYPATLHTDVEYYTKEVLKIPRLLSGDAGKLARTLHPNIPKHIVVFEGDGWSQENEWLDLYKHHSRTRIERKQGYHLDIARSETLGNIATRLAILRDERGFDGSFQSVDFSYVLEAALQGKSKTTNNVYLPHAA